MSKTFRTLARGPGWHSTSSRSSRVKASWLTRISNRESICPSSSSTRETRSTLTAIRQEWQAPSSTIAHEKIICRTAQFLPSDDRYLWYSWRVIFPLMFLASFESEKQMAGYFEQTKEEVEVLLTKWARQKECRKTRLSGFNFCCCWWSDTFVLGFWFHVNLGRNSHAKIHFNSIMQTDLYW